MTTWTKSFAEEKAERTIDLIVDLIKETAQKLLGLVEASTVLSADPHDVLLADLQAEIANALLDALKRHINGDR